MEVGSGTTTTMARRAALMHLKVVALSCGGLVLAWFLAMTLWLPVFNERNTYRDVAIRIADLKGPRRHKGIARPRMIAMYLARELTPSSFPEIGLRFGGKDHSTVINACKRIRTLQGLEPELAANVQSLRRQLATEEAAAA